MITGLIILFIVIAILGAIFGGESFGDTLRKGCSSVIILIILLIMALVYFLNI